MADFEGRERGIWRDMIRRCHVPSSSGYYKYGARGITVCDDWRTSFNTFFRDMGPRPSPQHCIERKDNDGSYSVENCRWATLAEQARNKRNSVKITIGAATLTQAEWARKLGVSPAAIRNRIARGLDPVTAVTRPFGHDPVAAGKLGAAVRWGTAAKKYTSYAESATSETVLANRGGI